MLILEVYSEYKNVEKFLIELISDTDLINEIFSNIGYYYYVVLTMLRVLNKSLNIREAISQENYLINRLLIDYSEEI